MQVLNLTLIVVDNSVVEVYANDVTVITTRVYPWLSTSTGAGFFICSSSSTTNSKVRYSSVEVWDGLVNAWPQRPDNTRKPLLWDGLLPDIWGLWAGI
jgi:beta-fructofuranosidase